MKQWFLLSLLLLGAGSLALAQVEELPSTGKAPQTNQAPPRDDLPRSAGVSSSRDTRIDLSPPADDAKNHPHSGLPSSDDSDVQEMHPWNPHKAMKDLEVGDFYFRQKNYRAALDRYSEALEYKPGDALANFHMGECFDKLDQKDEAVAHYQEYLKVLPNGPRAKEAEKALRKLGAEKDQASKSGPKS